MAAINLIAIDNPQLITMIRTVSLHNLQAAGTFKRLFDMITIEAASTARADPPTPIAMPTLAAAKNNAQVYLLIEILSNVSIWQSSIKSMHASHSVPTRKGRSVIYSISNHQHAFV